jgi:hypothetical protein
VDRIPYLLSILKPWESTAFPGLSLFGLPGRTLFLKSAVWHNSCPYFPLKALFSKIAAGIVMTGCGAGFCVLQEAYN